MALDTLLLFLTVATVTSLVPGPNMMMTMANGLAHGPRGAGLTVAGNLSSCAMMMAVSVAGFGAVLMASETAFQAVKWAGVAYLVYLGWKMWRAPAVEFSADAGTAARGSAWRIYRQGFLASASNPKAVLYFGALIPQFIDPARPLLPQVLIIGALGFTIEAIVMMAAGIGAARLSRTLATRGRGRLMNRVSGGTMVGAAALLSAVSR